MHVAVSHGNGPSRLEARGQSERDVREASEVDEMNFKVRVFSFDVFKGMTDRHANSLVKMNGSILHADPICTPCVASCEVCVCVCVWYKGSRWGG